ncbi:MAG: sec-C motif containing protein [Nocardioides sp.]|nr:sec-C motif containing protein [Nocardioides sp.]
MIGAQDCPCGSGTSYDACCGRLHRGAAQAETPEELMRSRYAAYAVRDADYVWRTWHPRTRPLSVTPDPDVRWTGLVVHEAGGDEVEFTARFERLGSPGSMHERSVFARRAGRWFYVEATTDSASS